MHIELYRKANKKKSESRPHFPVLGVILYVVRNIKKDFDLCLEETLPGPLKRHKNYNV